MKIFDVREAEPYHADCYLVTTQFRVYAPHRDYKGNAHACPETVLDQFKEYFESSSFEGHGVSAEAIDYKIVRDE